MQQVNLYTDAFKPLRVKLPLEQIIAIPIIVLIILVGVSFGLTSYLTGQKEELSGLQNKNEEMTERIAVLSAKAEKLHQDDGLVAANERLNKMLFARRNMISTLDRVVVKESEGFSHSLVALARQKEDGLWLNSIYLGGTNQSMILEGITAKAELVPKYLQKLRQEPSFLGKNFALFELNKSESYRSGLKFTLKAEDSNLNQAVDVQPMAQEMSIAQ
tara:strand:- start:2934 stop:3584 length:651 start_codon:yes stop_codon:yes gene_type:complete